MYKKFLFPVLFFGALTLASCEDKEPEITDDTDVAGDVIAMMIKDAGDRAVTVYSTEEAQPAYVSVIKSGHTPSNPATAVLKVLSDEELAAYLEKNYGNSEFDGLIPLHPDFYYLTDADGNAIDSNSYTHEFSDADDCYFGVNVMFRGQQLSDWWEALSTDSVNSDKVTGILNGTYSVVVPLGLFSPNDSVDVNNQYLMIQPLVEDPVMSVSIADGGYYIEDISRSKLIEDPTYLASKIEPAVTLSIPCSNPYGFQVRLSSTQASISQFMEFHTDIQLNPVTDQKVKDLTLRPHFAKGVTEIRLPLTFFPEYMDPEQIDVNYVVPVSFRAETKTVDMIWGAGEGDTAADEVPEKVQTSLKVPSSTTTWYSNGYLQSFGWYTIFVGYRVQETPLEITEENILAQNDCEPTEGSAAYLFDDDLSTFYHSAWSDPQYRSAPYGSYIDFEMPTEDKINAVAIQVTARVYSNPVSPRTITLFYANEYNIDKPDNTYWEPFAMDATTGGFKTYTISGTNSMGKLGSGQIGWFGGISKDSDWLHASGDFRYLRFSVLENTNGDDLTQTGTSTYGYWNLAEMKIYGKKF